MHIVFGHVLPWQVPMLKALSYFKLNVYYLYIIAGTDIKKNEIAAKLKKNNIYPLPIELEKKISPNPGLKILFSDPGEFSYKKNIKLVPDVNLKKYSNLFSIKEKNTKKLRLLIQDFVYPMQITVSSPLEIWSALYPREKIIFVSFNFKYFYMPDMDRNIFKIIIPVDLLGTVLTLPEHP